MMSKGLHILGFQNKLKTEKDFLKSLLCQNLSKRKLILEKSSTKQLRVIQTLLCLILRGEIGVSHHLFNLIKRSKKLSFIKQRFKKLAPDPNLKQHLLTIAPLIPAFVRLILKKKWAKNKKNPLNVLLLYLYKNSKLWNKKSKKPKWLKLNHHLMNLLSHQLVLFWKKKSTQWLLLNLIWNTLFAQHKWKNCSILSKTIILLKTLQPWII